MTGGVVRAEEQGTMLANRLAKRARHLGRWAKRRGVTCYRLYDRDIPEVPLVVDWYEGRVHVAELAPQRGDGGEDAAAREAWLDVQVAAVAAALGVASGDVFVKRRDRQRGRSQYQRLSTRGARFVVEEAGLRLRVNLSDYLDTGLFLDHRPLRARLREEASGLAVLNLFCYTGAFTVFAAAGRARSTTSVDMSRTYLAWAEDNLRLNGVAPSPGGHELVRADVDRFLADASASRRRWDLVVVDPPTFSNSKRMDRSFDVQRDHAGLLRRAFGLLGPAGALYFSTNARRFRLDDAVARWASVADITDETVPEDFRDRRPHRCYLLTKGAR